MCGSFHKHKSVYRISPPDFQLRFDLFMDRFLRTIGMFEQNNIGVRCEHPIASIASTIAPHSTFVAPILSAAEAISLYLEGGN